MTHSSPQLLESSPRHDTSIYLGTRITDNVCRTNPSSNIHNMKHWKNSSHILVKLERETPINHKISISGEMWILYTSRKNNISPNQRSIGKSNDNGRIDLLNRYFNVTVTRTKVSFSIY